MILNCIPILNDNYVWYVKNAFDDRIVLIDPGVGEAVLNYVNDRGWVVAGVLLTHYHFDHIGGVSFLLENCPILKERGDCIYGTEKIKQILGDDITTVNEGDKIYFDFISSAFNVLALPGHTFDSIGYYIDNKLFSGDTLFSGGCGRVFDGTINLLFKSIKKILALPLDIVVYSSHEYTLDNLKFCLMIEPDNENLLAKIKAVQKEVSQGLPTVPTFLQDELKYNVFLRTELESVRNKISYFSNGLDINDDFECFKQLRLFKNEI